MLVFITSVRHPHNATDYDRVEELLARSLRSVTSQTADDYRVIVVGNRPPRYPLGARVEFVAVDFPPPSPAASARTTREAVLTDKGTKLAVATLAARAHHPDHLMIFDADDLLSTDIAGFVGNHPHASGWYVDNGYLFDARRQLVRPLSRFNDECGSSLILQTSLLDIPDLPLHASQGELIEAFGAFTVFELLGSHLRAVDHFAATGRALAPLLFPGAMYVVDTGENHSGRTLEGFARPLRPVLPPSSEWTAHHCDRPQ